MIVHVEAGSLTPDLTTLGDLIQTLDESLVGLLETLC